MKTINAAVIGPPGSGKSHSFLTIENFAKATKKPFAIIDVDGKIAQIPGIVNSTHFTILDPSSREPIYKLNDAIRRFSMAPNDEPKGWPNICGIVDHLSENADQYCGAALDTLTLAESHIKDFISFTNRKARTKWEFAEWGILLMSYQELFKSFYRIPVQLKIINLHSQYDKNELTGAVQILPLITGQFKDHVGQYMSEFFLAGVNDKGMKGIEYVWRAAPIPSFMARSIVFQGKVEIPQNWEPIWQTLFF